jgi:phage gp46-like protein
MADGSGRATHGVSTATGIGLATRGLVSVQVSGDVALDLAAVDLTDAAIRFDLAEAEGDIRLEEGDLLAERGLGTALLLSLFVDGRARPGDVLPFNDSDPRGWWGDEVGNEIGSRLWLLSREKQLQSTLRRAKQYADEALAWFVEDGVALEVLVTTEYSGEGVMAIAGELVKPDGARVDFRFEYAWQGTT